MHARWTWFAGSVRERETHARSDNSFSENDTSITRRGAAITISPSANPPKGDMDIVKPKGNPPRCVRIHGIDTLVEIMRSYQGRVSSPSKGTALSAETAGLGKSSMAACLIGTLVIRTRPGADNPAFDRL